MRTITVRLLIISLLMLTCSGCAIDLGLKPPAASAHYMLAVATDSPAKTAMHSVPTVSIDRPQANAFLNSTGIAVIQPDQKVLYYAKGQWATVLPEMMQSAVIRSLNATLNVRAFNNEQPGIAADYHLIWSIEDFYARYNTDASPPQVYVTINCWLIDNDTDSALATSVFAQQQEASELALEPIVESFNTAVTSLLSDMNAWLTNTVEKQQAVKAAKTQQKTTNNN